MYQLPANTLRVRLGTSEKFYIQLISNNTPFNISGSIGAGYVPNATQQISVASRFAVYNSTATEIRVQVWR
jgi:hypothetical protein